MKKIVDSIGLIDDDLILEAKETRKKDVKFNLKVLAPICACFIFVCAFVYIRFDIKSMGLDSDSEMLKSTEEVILNELSNANDGILTMDGTTIEETYDINVIFESIESDMNCGTLSFVKEISINSDNIHIDILLDPDTEENRNEIYKYATNSSVFNFL